MRKDIILNYKEIYLKEPFLNHIQALYLFSHGYIIHKILYAVVFSLSVLPDNTEWNKK